MQSDFTVVIATRNRPVLLDRAVRSTWISHDPRPAVIVVDDCSTTDVSIAMRELDSDIVCLRNSTRSGPGVSRNAGIARANTRFVVVLDDDDMLVPDALATIDRQISALANASEYPCLQFARSNGSLDRDFGIVGLADFVTGKIHGDFTPVVQRDVFLSENLAYPDSIVGGEHLLWFEVAKRFGIPTWSTVVTILGTEAPTRLCSVANQLERPEDYAAMQEKCLQAFGPDIMSLSRSYYRKRCVGAATYRLIAGDRRAARGHIERALRNGITPALFGAWAASWLPGSLVRQLFRYYRCFTM